MQDKLILFSFSAEKKALRKSTAEKSRSTEDCIREREAKAELLRQIAEKKKVAEVRRLTQEELLAEAKITEEINMRSLGKLSEQVIKVQIGLANVIF